MPIPLHSQTEKKETSDKQLFTKTNFIHYVLVSILISLVVGLSIYPAYFKTIDGFFSIKEKLIFSFTLSMVLSFGITYFERILNYKIPWIRYPFRRLVIEIIIVTAFSFTVSFVLMLIFHVQFGSYLSGSIPWRELVKSTKLSVGIAYVITLIFTAKAFLFEWREAAVDAEKLRTEQFSSQYRMLKEQLNPHFLFNSLNVLTHIIYEDKNKAAGYVQQLSRFYRYVLEVQYEDLVRLGKEMEFVHRYLYLQKLRFGKNLTFDIKVEPGTDGYIPPLSIQICLENVFKHNEISQAKPLLITIEGDRNWLCITNTSNPKNTIVSENTGVGLNNIQKRYRLLSDTEISIQKTGKTFAVTLPILKLES